MILTRIVSNVGRYLENEFTLARSSTRTSPANPSMSFGLAGIHTTNRGRIWLSAPQIIHKTFEGQDVTINLSSKVMIMDLNQIFRHARQKLDWDEKYGNTAFGINRSIMNFVIGSEFKLLIRFSPDQNSEYWINFDKLRDFKKSVYCLTFVKSTMIYNIPVSLFHSKPNFSGVAQ